MKISNKLFKKLNTILRLIVVSLLIWPFPIANADEVQVNEGFEDSTYEAGFTISATSDAIQIYSAEINQYGTTGSETRYVDQVITHPNYDGWSLDNDYALLHLTEPSSFEPIKLITDESHDNDGVWTTTMGWGATSSGGWGIRCSIRSWCSC